MSTIGLVAGVVSTVLLLLLLLAATCCLWKRRGSQERMEEEEEHGNGQGFDNIAFRDVRGWGVGTLCGPLLSSQAAFNGNRRLGGSFLLILRADPLLPAVSSLEAACAASPRSLGYQLRPACLSPWLPGQNYPTPNGS